MINQKISKKFKNYVKNLIDQKKLLRRKNRWRLRKKVHLEQPLSKTGTDSTISVSYITSRRAKTKKKDEDKLDDDKGKRIKRLSRIKKDSLL